MLFIHHLLFLWCTDVCVCLVSSDMWAVSNKLTQKSAVWDHTTLSWAVIYLFITCYLFTGCYFNLVPPTPILELKGPMYKVQYPLVVRKHTEISTNANPFSRLECQSKITKPRAAPPPGLCRHVLMRCCQTDLCPNTRLLLSM